MSTEAWNEYLTGSTCNAPAVNKTNLRRRLEERKSKVFLRRGNIKVRITDIGRGRKATSTVYNDQAQLSSALGSETANDVGIRILSIYSKSSIKPLMITSELMCQVLQRHSIHPDFLQVVLSFGEEPHVAEAGSSNSAVYSSQNGAPNSYISYQMNYVEENFRKMINPWSFRHTGIYHHHSSQLDLFIILHPNEESILDTRLCEWLGVTSDTSSLEGISSLQREPNSLHLFVLSSFLDNWRWYLRHLGERFSEMNDEALTTQPEEAEPKESFIRVKALRNLNDWAHQAQACCKSNIDIVKKLRENVSIQSQSEIDELRYFQTALEGYIQSCEALMPRIRNTIDLVGYTLTLHNQLETAQVDKELRDLTAKLQNVTNELRDLQQDSVDDSVTVKIITFVSAFYLPGSFVVSFFGMNFFAFDQAARRIVIANDFWVFLAVWLPLTGATAVFYLLIVYFHCWWNHKPFHVFRRPKTRIGTEETICPPFGKIG